MLALTIGELDTEAVTVEASVKRARRITQRNSSPLACVKGWLYLRFALRSANALAVQLGTLPIDGDSASELRQVTQRLESTRQSLRQQAAAAQARRGDLRWYARAGVDTLGHLVERLEDIHETILLATHPACTDVLQEAVREVTLKARSLNDRPSDWRAALERM